MQSTLNLRRLRVVDLCCGCGMASRGLLSSGGYEIEMGVDVWDLALEAFAANVGQSGVWGGTSVERAAWDLLDNGEPIDVVLTGPPCQDDSRANQKSDKGRGAIKAPAFDAALALRPTWIVMEMVSSKYVDWCREQGARQVLKLRDCDVGGYTSRERWFAIWGPRDLVVEMTESRGWGEALGVTDPDARLGTDANSKAKRWRLARAPHEPASAVVGQGRAHIMRDGNGQERRLSAAEEARLSGFSSLTLVGTRREQQTQVGNGWPKSFGRSIGRAIQRATYGRTSEPKVEGDLDLERLHQQSVENQTSGVRSVELPTSTFSF